ncbi:dihydrolipoyllysine-residue acetyltransferase component of acetoin cleaving system [Brevibacillus reuszeri]|uniref:dihydrolipoamide acetyltransferase family protein n=1 Tax=Brevibacillus reuszeri TaxID=54915 RepID=UPI001B17EDF3|nr:dihydrolipoamide acetyltransferase family protein [Brevibacillus reuszeri]GIO08579.1 dihydrolipoyllysine-residue acetyltransferase component of acetoin cleaving system [Brevibacillus reuszeri]
MAENIIMPKLGMAMVEGTVIGWKKQAGDTVKKGEGIVDISSEKIEMEVEAPADGVLLSIDVPQGGVVPYGTVLGVVGQPGDLVAIAAPPATASGNAQAESAASLAVQDQQEAQTSVAVAAASFSPQSRNGIKISPVARKIAEEEGVDYTLLIGTGPQGRITKEDVERAVQARGQIGVKTEQTKMESIVSAANGQSAVSGTTAASPDTEPSKTPERIPVTGMRKVIAERMHTSLQQSAQLTINMQADITELLQLKEKLAAEMEARHQLKLSVTDWIARSVVLALLRHKQMNSAFFQDRIEIYEEVHLGIAVALEKGLVVPVIRHADAKTLAELSHEIKMISTKARQNQLAPEEMKGSTFTITNLGGYGVDTFTPVLNPPETGILGIGASRDTPVYIGGELQRRSLLPLSLTFDHRALDGAPAAAFLAEVRRYLEEPYSLLI